MIRINLLPFRAARTKENVRRQVTIFTLLLILLLISLFGVSLFFKKELADMKSQVASVNAQLSTYTAKAKEVDNINKKKQLLQKKIDIINDLQLVRKEPVSVLEAMTDLVVAERMWLTEMAFKGKDLTLKGVALDEITIADFTKRLQSSPLFSNATLKYLKQTTTDGISTKNFEIVCTKVKPEQIKKQATSKAIK